jgi:hypothetical protein
MEADSQKTLHHSLKFSKPQVESVGAGISSYGGILDDHIQLLVLALFVACRM